MKKLLLLTFLFIYVALASQVSSPLIGTWKLAQIPGALSVGPNQGDASWWSNSAVDLTTRDCLFDDSIIFDASGNMMHYMDGNTYRESWQGVAEQCGGPVAPHDGGLFTYLYSNNQLTVNGLGAHLGMPKAVNGGELSDANPPPVPTSISYIITFFNGDSSFHADIQSAAGGSAWWRFTYHKTGLAVSSPLIGTWKLAQIPGALSVGPNQGDASWWSSSANDIFTKDCIFDDSISFDANGNFIHYMDGSTWLETWQGVASDQCGGPIAPHGGGLFNYFYSNNQLIVNGLGAHLGVPKAVNGGELSDANPPPVPTSISYIITFFNGNNSFHADIQSAAGGSAWWRFTYQKTNLIACNTVYHYDTLNTFVSDILFQSISPQSYLISLDTFPQFSNPNCDSVVSIFRQFNFNPNYYSDTLTIYDTLLTYDTINIIDTTYVSISVTDTLYIDITVTGIPNLDNTISVYPNPANDVVTIDNGNYSVMSNYSLVIFNSLSQQVFSSQINTQQFQIPVSTLGAEGTYFIQIFDGNNNLVIKKYLVLN